MDYVKISKYLSQLLRWHPEAANLTMDIHGYVDVEELLHNMKYKITMEQLKELVATNDKKRFKFNEDHTRIKACQGHGIPWVIPELTYKDPPQYVYHGTTLEAYDKIVDCGYISRMKRHAVHTQEDIEKAWKSARRWKRKQPEAIPVVLKISARKMQEDGYNWGVSDNDVWCVEQVPEKYIEEVMKE